MMSSSLREAKADFGSEDISIPVKVSNCRGRDFEENMWTCSVGEASKRFPDEEMGEDGAAMQWIFSVIDLIRKHTADATA